MDEILPQGAVAYTVNWAEILSKLAGRVILHQTLNIDAGQVGDAQVWAF